MHAFARTVWSFKPGSGPPPSQDPCHGGAMIRGGNPFREEQNGHIRRPSQAARQDGGEWQSANTLRGIARGAVQ